MKPKLPRQPHMPSREPLDAKAIDELYGLEPVFEPEPDADTYAAPTDFTTIMCPYCGERYDTRLDLTGGTSVYIEDCQVCCQPIELTVTLNERDELLSVDARRTD